MERDAGWKKELFMPAAGRIAFALRVWGEEEMFWKKKKEEQQGEKQEKVFFLHNPPNILVLRRSDVGYPDEHTGEAARCFSSGYPLLCHKTIILN